MSQLIDTSILGRLANTADSFHATALRSVVELHRRGETLVITAQNLIEFRNMATRPIAGNGLGLTAAEAARKSLAFESTFPMLDEIPAIFPAWKAIVDGLGIVGKQVHDARLVAICHVHGVSHVLTFNTNHFSRLATYGPGVLVVDPATL